MHVLKKKRIVLSVSSRALLRSLSAERMTVLLHYLTFLFQTAAKKCIFFHRKAYSFKDDECEGKN